VDALDTLTGIVTFAAIVGVMIWLVTAYNNLLAAAHRASQAWGNVDALLRQRNDRSRDCSMRSNRTRNASRG
jgi:hypothetical protein